MAAQLRLASKLQNKPQDNCNNVLWTDETKVEMTICRNQTLLINTYA